MAAADEYRNRDKEVTNYDRFYGFSSNGDYGGGGGWGGNGGALPGWAAGSNSGFLGYSYKYGKYWENLSNDEVSFDEVYNNDIVPNSTPLYSRSSGYNLTNIGYNSSTGFSLSMSNSSSFTSMSLENSLDFASIIFQTYIKAPPSPSSNGAQNSNTIDNCGVETYAWFSTKSAAEKYLKNNSGCEKEKFFYIFTTKSVLVGPWKDATRFETSPQYADKYDRKGNVIFNGTTYRVARFVHTHPDNADPSDRDHDVHNFFMNNGGSNISTEIFFDGTYYRYW